jgi:hypothetical protein
MSEDSKQEPKPIEHPVPNLGTRPEHPLADLAKRPSTEGRSAAEVWKEEAQIIEVS